MPTLIERARAAARTAAMAGFTLGMMSGVRVRQRVSPEAARYEVYQAWMKRWCQGLLDIFGVHAVIVGAAELPPLAASARLVVSNHRSPLDILLLLRQFGGCVLSRADLATWPVLGPAAISAGTIFVDRKDTMSGVVAVRKIRDRLIRGRTVIVYPEGTTYAGDEVRTFHEGAFAAARGLNIELVPVGIAYQAGSEFVEPTFGAHLARVAGRTETRVAVAVGAPLPMLGSRRETAAALHTEIQALVLKARASLSP
ncbi:MAG TPA: lysophospholipid acyltransferase family protein [Polyangiales bacterium]|nr:lysophospholipid acyltransferase family protein [Polyangiales bacterium]